MGVIRSFNWTDADYHAHVSIHNAIWVDWQMTTDYMRFRDDSWPKGYLYQRFVMEEGGGVVATATVREPYWSYRPGKVDVAIAVHPEHQNQGIGGTLYDHVLAMLGQREQPLIAISGETREDRAAAIYFLEKRGFELVMRYPRSRLDVASFDPTLFAHKAAQAKANGIRITTLAELSQTDLEWQRKIWELDTTCSQDEPSPDLFTPTPFEQYIAQIFEAPKLLLDGWFVAVDDKGASEHLGEKPLRRGLPADGTYVGMSVLHKNLSDPKQLDVGFTAVLPAYRRKGIATALKSQAIVYAQQHGITQLLTGNEETNPMLAINLQLGFKEIAADLSFSREF